MQSIDAVAIDPHRGYLRGLLAYLPDASVTVDCCHGVKLVRADQLFGVSVTPTYRANEWARFGGQIELRSPHSCRSHR